MDALRRVAVFLKPYRRDAIIAPLLMVLEVMMDLTLPFLMRRIIDLGIGGRNLPLVFQTGLIMVGCGLVGAVGGIGCTVFAVRASMSYGADVRSAVYRKIQSLSFGNLDRLGTGLLVTRLTNDVNQVQDVVLIALRILVRAPLLVVGSLIMAIVASPSLAPLLAVLVPLLVLVLVLVIRGSFPLFYRVQANLDRLNTTIQENLAGVRVVKAFVRADHEEKRFGVANETLMGSSIKAMQFTAVVGPFMMLPAVCGSRLATNLPLAIVSLAVVPLTVATRFIARNSLPWSVAVQGRQGFCDQQPALVHHRGPALERGSPGAALGDLNGIIEETITGAKVIHAYGREQAVIDDFEGANRRFEQQRFVPTPTPACSAHWAMWSARSVSPWWPSPAPGWWSVP